MTMRKINRSLLLLFAFSAACVGQTKTHTYEHELLDIVNTWHTVAVPVNAFAKASPDLTDLRIKGITASNDTVIAPYFLSTTEEQTITEDLPFIILNATRKGNSHYYTFEAQELNIINNIVLEFKNQNYDWDLKLEGSDDNQTYFTLLNRYRILNIENEHTGYTFNTLRFNNARFKYYRIAITSKEVPELLNAKLTDTKVQTGSYNTYTIQSIARKEHKADKQTHLFITLKHAVPLSKLAFEIYNDYDYFRPVRILYVTDSIKTEKGWMRNYGNLTNNTISSREPIDFKIPSTFLKQLKVIIENGDNEPLDITKITVKGYSVSLIARFDNEARYFLTYGNHRLSKPDYDIERFKDRIPAQLSRLTLAPRRTITKITEEPMDPMLVKIIWLWGVVGIILLVVGWYTVKMMRKQ